LSGMPEVGRGRSLLRQEHSPLLREGHTDVIIKAEDMVPVNGSGKIDPRSSRRLLEVQRGAIHQALRALPRDHADYLRRILDAVDRFLPEEFGGSPAREQS
jgi:hypothetical protein